jgi:hypothetical protein
MSQSFKFCLFKLYYKQSKKKWQHCYELAVGFVYMLLVLSQRERKSKWKNTCGKIMFSNILFFASEKEITEKKTTVSSNPSLGNQVLGQVAFTTFQRLGSYKKNLKIPYKIILPKCRFGPVPHSPKCFKTAQSV